MMRLPEKVRENRNSPSAYRLRDCNNIWPANSIQPLHSSSLMGQISGCGGSDERNNYK